MRVVISPLKDLPIDGCPEHDHHVWVELQRAYEDNENQQITLIDCAFICSLCHRVERADMAQAEG